MTSRYSKLAIVVSHEFGDDTGDNATVQMTNGDTSIQLSDFASALAMLPPGSKVVVVAEGSVGHKAVHRLSRIIRESAVFVSLDLSAVTEMTRVHENPFENNTHLLEIRFPKNLLTINPRGFSGCTELVAAYIPASVMRIGENAFVDCPNLAHITFAAPDGWQYKSKKGSIQDAADFSLPQNNPSYFASASAKYADCVVFKGDYAEPLAVTA